MSKTNSRSGEGGTFPIVGIGASAGGLGAFEKLFAAMPANSGMAFVLVQHLDPTHESLTGHLLSHYTEMPVIEAADGMGVMVNSLYIIPPNRYLAISDRTLQLTEPKLQRGMRMPIDFFLRSLAEAQREKAIAIILSGTGSDGTLGVRAVKGEGGIALAQSPETAQYDGMPRSAIATGLVDYVGPIESMPEVLLRYNAHAFINKAVEPAALAGEVPDMLRSILSVLQARTRYDFRCYKKGTLLRRITRRMGLNQIGSLGGYLAFLRVDPDEPRQLFKDLLIGVTGFFREAQSFEALERAVAKIVERKGPDEAIRIWVPGCASGEEPYSIAMLVSEQLQAAQKACPIQLFATDIDEAALAMARAGLYPENIAADVSPERLQRFFKREGNSFRVSKHIRDSVVFAVQNLIADPPFSKLDLVSCRNVLIYLEPEIQKKVIGLFHFSLIEDGYLFLGSAESIGQQEDLFEPVVKKLRLYRRLGAARRNVVEFPIFPARHEQGTPGAAERPLLSEPGRLADFTREVLLKSFAPASVLVDRKYQILYYHGPMARYMEQPAGPPHEDLLRKVPEGLRIKLRGLLHKVVHESDGPASGIAELRDGHQTRHITISVTPVSVPRQAEGLLLVSFQDDPLPQTAAAVDESADAGDALVLQLERELQSTRDDLQRTIEEMEASNEELKAANEEVMSVNEELQSTNEELETSKEELQSLNEELSTVNSQLEEKVRELELTNDDLDNLLSSTNIATIFLDPELRIKRFTPATAGLFNLIATDRGRPLSDISREFEDPDLLADARKVLERLVPIENDVRTTDGERWYLRRILPYRTRDDRIQGVVVTFLDVTERKRRLEWFRLIVEAMPNAVVVANKDGQIEFVNSQTEQFFGYERNELVGRPVEILIPERFRTRHTDHRSGYFARPERRAMGDALELSGRRKDGSEFSVEVGLSPVPTNWGTYVLATIIDTTERRRVAQALREAKAQAERANQAKSLFLASASHDLRQPLQTLTLLNGVLGRKVQQDPVLLDTVKKQDVALASMRHLLNLFLDLGRLDAGSIRPQLTDIALNSLLDTIRDEFSPLAQASNLALHIVPCSAKVRSDATLLHRIVQNFVANAVKFTAAGRVLVGCRRRGAMLRIEVWDTGPGIPAEHLGIIFDEFVKLDNPARQSVKGYGVGLAAAKQMAQLLGHRLDVRSTPGKGSMFAVEVPLTRSTETTAQGSADTPSVPYEGKAGAGVLVIEDDPEVLAAMRTLLESLGLTVTAVSSGVEALARLKAGGEPFDLIIADYRLEEVESGVNVVRHILDALERKIPVLLLSGDTLPASVRAMETSGYRVLQKPIEADRLVAEMNQLLAV
jgi:two-component system CheB/CheR fusion protein